MNCRCAAGVGEGLMDKVEACLFIAHQFEDVHIQWQPVTPKERLPRFDVAFPGFGHGQLFAFSHYQHLHPVECRERAKVQRGWNVGACRGGLDAASHWERRLLCIVRMSVSLIAVKELFGADCDLLRIRSCQGPAEPVRDEPVLKGRTKSVLSGLP